MEFGISTSFIKNDGRTILDYLRVFKQTGFSVIEIDAHKYQTFPYTSRDFMHHLRDELRTMGITVNSVHTPFHHSLSDPDRDTRQAGIHQILELMESILPLSEIQGRMPYLVIHPGHHLSRTPANKQTRFCVESLQEILSNPLAENFRFCLENMLSSHFCGRADELLELVHRIGDDRLSICLDTSHSVYDSTPVEFLDDVYPYLVTTHISDNYHQSEGEFHAIPMTLLHSRVDWPLFFQRLNQKLDTVIFELKCPPLLDNDLLLEMTQVAVIQIRRFLL